MRLRPFDIGLAVVFGVLFFLAIFILKDIDPKSEPGKVEITGEVRIWGTVPNQVFNEAISELNRETNDSFSGVSYRYVHPDEFDNTFITALADQEPPDLLLMSHERLVEHRRRLQPISYKLFPERDFRDVYVDGASIFTMSDGVYAFPVMVDPLVMYWNKDILSDRGFLIPPKTWEELVSVYAPAITARDFNRKINLSTIAMGGYSNVKNAFPIISTLLLQQGSTLVREAERGYEVSLNNSSGVQRTYPLNTTLSFYTSFGRVNNSLYNWNRVLDLDRDVFLREDLAFYLGYGSEGASLEDKNPNLNFDITEIPQPEDAVNKRTYGKFYGFFIPRAANNINGAYLTMSELSNQSTAKKIADGYNMAPVHIESLLTGSNDIYGRIIYQSAPLARAWLNPDLDRLNTIFADILEDVTSNRSTTQAASGDATTRIQQIY